MTQTTPVTPKTEPALEPPVAAAAHDPDLSRLPATASRRGGRWIEHWTPEDPDFWAGGGAKVARRNLWWSILAEHVGFSVWLLWRQLMGRLPSGTARSEHAVEVAVARLRTVVGAATVQTVVKRGYRLNVC